MKRSTALTCTAAIAAVAAMPLAATPAAQAAKPKRKHKQAIYELRLKGSEAVAWTYKSPPDACSSGATGNGSQEVIYDTRKIKVKAVKSKIGLRPGLVQFALVGDKSADIGFPQGIPAVVSVEREGDIKSEATCGGTGHSTQTPPPPDCGLRYGRIRLETGFHAAAAFSVTGRYDNFARPAQGDTDDIVPPPFPPASGELLENVYENCPLLLPSGMQPAQAELTTAAKRLLASRLPKKGKTLKLSAGDRDEATDPDGQRHAETSVAWNLTLKRVR
jgi:hypothetical protein